MNAVITILRHDLTHAKGLGDIVHAFSRPVAQAIKAPCIDAKGELKEDSPCKKRSDKLNAMFPFNK
jgi:hypothetical protein